MLQLRVIVVACLVVAAAAQDTGKKTYTYKTVGGLDIQADVHRLPGEEARPAIFWIHGGALIMGSRNGPRADQLRRYLDAGFVVVSIDYRLAPETKLAGILDDVADAWRWVQTEGPNLFRVDPKRVAVVGHSAGGYLTLTTGYRLRPMPRALVSYYGYGDIAADWYGKPDPFYLQQAAVTVEEARQVVGTTPLAEPPRGNRRGRFYLYTRQQGLWPQEVAGFDPAVVPKVFDLYCPARNVTKTYPPTLLLHGDVDTDVPFSQSEQMAAELKRHGVEHELIRISGGGHGFDGNLQDPQAAAAFDKALAFLKRQTR